MSVTNHWQPFGIWCWNLMSWRFWNLLKKPGPFVPLAMFHLICPLHLPEHLGKVCKFKLWSFLNVSSTFGQGLQEGDGQDGFGKNIILRWVFSVLICTLPDVLCTLFSTKIFSWYVFFIVRLFPEFGYSQCRHLVRWRHWIEAGYFGCAAL